MDEPWNNPQKTNKDAGPWPKQREMDQERRRDKAQPETQKTVAESWAQRHSVTEEGAKERSGGGGAERLYKVCRGVGNRNNPWNNWDEGDSGLGRTSGDEGNSRLARTCGDKGDVGDLLRWILVLALAPGQAPTSKKSLVRSSRD